VGLARTAVRLKDVPAACRSYRDLLELWGTRTAAPPEVLEARTFVDERGCAR
jgi:phage tail sheath protein FI